MDQQPHPSAAYVPPTLTELGSVTALTLGSKEHDTADMDKARYH